MTLCGVFRATCEYNFMEAILFLASITSENKMSFIEKKDNLFPREVES